MENDLSFNVPTMMKSTSYKHWVVLETEEVRRPPGERLLTATKFYGLPRRRGLGDSKSFAEGEMIRHLVEP